MLVFELVSERSTRLISTGRTVPSGRRAKMTSRKRTLPGSTGRRSSRILFPSASRRRTASPGGIPASRKVPVSPRKAMRGCPRFSGSRTTRTGPESLSPFSTILPKRTPGPAAVRVGSADGEKKRIKKKRTPIKKNRSQPAGQLLFPRSVLSANFSFREIF